MVGAKIHPAAQAEVLELEQALVSELCQDSEQMARLRAEAPGTRRDLLLFLGQPAFEWLEDQSLSVTFSLSAGAYATQVLREFTREGWLKTRK
jgi:tRNA(Glu) U13 pseudouridine synthase TruD